MLKRDYDQTCSVARSLEVLGERWTLLVIRDIFYGKRRFAAIQEDLGVARNVLANQHRSQRRWGRLHLKVAGQPQQHAPDADGIVERQPVLDALGKLPPDDAELLRLLTWEQLRQSEAAQVLGISENAVALRASRARKRLAEILDDRSSNVVDMKDRTTERRSDEV